MRFVRSLDFRGWALLGATALCIALPGASRRWAIRRMPASPSKNANCRCTSTGSRASRIAGAGSARSASSPRTARGIRRVRARTPAWRRHHRAGFQRRLGQRFHRARPALPQPRRADDGRHQRSHRRPRRASAPSVVPEAYCESMCVFLLLSGKTRYVPTARMSACTRSGWATAPTTPGPQATPRRT